jgi:hypothetical protein
MAYLAAAYQAIGKEQKAKRLVKNMDSSWPELHIDIFLHRLFRYPRHVEQILVQLRAAGWQPKDRVTKAIK